MLKLKLATLDGLDPLVAKEYKKDGDVYVLDTDVVFEDVTPLKNSLLQEREAHKATKKEKAALDTQIVDLTARAGTATDLEKSWTAKLTAAEQAAKTKADALTAQLQTLLVDNVATVMAAELSTAPALLVPHIRTRLAVAEDENGKLVTRVLGEDGKVSALTVKELKESISANKDFAPILTGSRASGGGANGDRPPAGGKKFGDMNETELVALHKQVGDVKFKEMAAEAKAAT